MYSIPYRLTNYWNSSNGEDHRSPSPTQSSQADPKHGRGHTCSGRGWVLPSTLRLPGVGRGGPFGCAAPPKALALVLTGDSNRTFAPCAFFVQYAGMYT